jgi:hypothetical protein
MKARIKVAIPSTAMYPIIFRVPTTKKDAKYTATERHSSSSTIGSRFML